MGSHSPEEGAVIVGKDGVEKQLPLTQARKFSVFEREKITLAIGDRIRFTKNVKHRGHKFLNNELRTVLAIHEGKIIFDKGEIMRNGASFHRSEGARFLRWLLCKPGNITQIRWERHPLGNDGIELRSFARRLRKFILTSVSLTLREAI